MPSTTQATFLLPAQADPNAWQRFIHALRRNALLRAGFVITLVMFFLALAAPMLADFNPKTLNLDAILNAPAAPHWLGTDDLGRDVFSRMLYGARVSLWVGFVAVGISTAIGTVLGLLAGWYRGLVDECIMRFVDVMLCFPSFFLILAVIAFLGPSLVNIMIVIGLTSWPGTARLVRAETLSLRERAYVDAARLAGAGTTRILARHILPGALPPILVSVTLGIAGAILAESALSFLGIGIQHPMPSWGNILTQGKDNLEAGWWLSVFPGLAILVTALGYNLLGEGLRDLIDSRPQR